MIVPNQEYAPDRHNTGQWRYPHPEQIFCDLCSVYIAQRQRIWLHLIQDLWLITKKFWFHLLLKVVPGIYQFRAKSLFQLIYYGVAMSCWTPTEIITFCIFKRCTYAPLLNDECSFGFSIMYKSTSSSADSCCVITIACLQPKKSMNVAMAGITSLLSGIVLKRFGYLLWTLSKAEEEA